MNRISTVAANRQIADALELCHQRVRSAIDLAVAVQQIPAPTFGEAERAAFVEQKFLDIGLSDVTQDDMHNVYARLPGRSSDWPVILSAHTDTVFASDTDLTVTFENGQSAQENRISGPGLADNALGVAGVLLVAGLLVDSNVCPDRDIWFVANVCEEGLGDLRGMRRVVERFGSAASYIVVEGGSFGHIFHQAIGVRRFRLTVETPGGHSWGDYGSPNAIHILGRIIDRLDRLRLPENPKTTINVGVIEGGTTINSIAARSSCLIDMRSVDPNLLEALVADVDQIVREHAREFGTSITMSQIGSRPAGALDQETPLVGWAADALKLVGCQQLQFMAGSTDANIPISMGIPSVCIGLANSGNTHRVDEFLDPHYLPQGLSQLLLLTVAAAGLDDEESMEA